MKLMKFVLITIFAFLIVDVALAQNEQLRFSQQFRLAERLIRIAEPGQIVDSVNVWGDINGTGRYLVPKGTNLNELVSYAFGPRTLRDGQTNLDWSKMRVEIYVNRLNEQTNEVEYTTFKYRFEEPLPLEMYSFKIQNNETVVVRVKRRPSFRDYLGVFASTISAVASTVILLDRLNGN